MSYSYRTLDLTLISAKDLKEINLLGKMDVYVQVSLSTDPRSRQRTKTHVDGGKNPAWNSTLRFTVPADQPAGTLDILLRAEKTMGDKDVGEIHVPLKELLAAVSGDGPSQVQFLSYQVRTPNSGKQRGILNFSYKLSEKITPTQSAAPAGYPPFTTKSDTHAPAYPPAGAYPPANSYPPAGAYPPANSYPPAGAYPPPSEKPSKGYDYPPAGAYLPPSEKPSKGSHYPPAGAYPPHSEKPSKGSAEPVTAYPPGSSSAVPAYPYGAPPPQHGAPYGYPPQQEGYGYPPPQQGGYGYPPPQQGGYNYPPQQGGYGYPPQQGGYGYPPQQAVQPQKNKSKFGMGLGAGLIGGAVGGLLLGEVVEDVYDSGFDAGYDDGGFDF